MSLFYHLEIRFADPISAIGMNERYLFAGSMMGRIAMFCFEDKKTNLLAELSSENITGITFENTETCNIAIGDEEILKYKVNTTDMYNTEFYRLSNYDNENNHKSRCESCYTILSNVSLLMVYLSQSTDNNNINISTQRTPLRVFIFNILNR